MRKLYLFTLLFGLSLTTMQAQLTDVITGLTFPYDAAIYENDLYVTELGADRIIKLDLSVPAPPAIEVVLNGLGNPAAMTISGTDLYYGESDLDRISKIDLTATDPVPEIVVNTGLATPNDLLVDGNFLYITDEGTSQITRLDLTEENPVLEVILSGVSVPLGLAKDGDILYCSVFSSSSLISIDLSQTPFQSTTVVSGLSQPAGITLDGSFIYIAENGRISRIDLNETTPTLETVVSDGVNGSRNVTFDGVDLYLAQTGGTFGGTGLISKLTINMPVFSSLPDVCLGDTPNMLGGASPATGVYSGPGVTDNGDGSTFTFDPVAAGGVGIYTITYTLNGNPVTSEITVLPAPDVMFSTGELMVQEDAGVQTGLSGGTPAGGFYSGNGVTDDGNGMTYTFDPAAAGEGENVITYIFVSAEGCAGLQSAVITVTPAIVPGDECDDPIDISAQFGGPFNEPQTTGLLDNSGFTVGAEDPINGIDCFYGGDVIQNSGYYSFIGDGNTYRVRSVQCTGPNENLDLQVAVYSGACGSLTDVACNEDEDPANGVFNISVEFATEEGVEYIMLIDGFNGEAGQFCLEVTNLSEPMDLPGDFCAIAIDINNLFGQAEMMPQVSEEYDVEGYNEDPTDPNETDPQCGFALDIFELPSIWFSFTGDGNTYTINSTSDVNADMAAIMYSGTCGMLTQVACNDDDSGLNFGIEYETEAGVEYFIYTFNVIIPETGPFNLQITNQGTTGITDLSTTDLRIFPNPTTGWVQLPQVELERVEAYDATGRRVLNQQGPATAIDLSTQPAGLYLLKLYNGEEVYSAKVVKE